ncbi:acrylyl-CoA reductase (NADPH) [Desulfopila aestuarii]|uniref:Putative quinone oxidoreductase, YhdH/YhfP family n=1 Tax=Desulfopila aestuarii DSM 18488 TaxID=1121416 RepID=A0A1M7YFA6_9BACT|nr:MDR family oxidoreductase [Desulfopila aestuarii]SHO51324.1 putative quinone oxidoreductase, YhdH/YhfP family [Desulfopila aestuarii DSM 18488]
MPQSFSAIEITKDEEGQHAKLTTLTEDDLMAGDVTVGVEYSALNYKDGLAMTGKAPVVRRFPLVPGIDFAGTVTSSEHPAFQAGDKVVLNGFGVGEVHSGGFSQMARVKGDWLVKLPEGLTTRQAMAVGTAGYTSMLCVMALEQHGVTPASGDILVTGAAGGVGSVAVLLLAKLGYRVVAVTGRMAEAEYLKSLGAAEVIERQPFGDKPKPLAKELWAGAVDVAGGNTLANVLSQIRYGGAVAACGLAESMNLPTSVAPFILRGVTLYGIDSVMAPIARREQAWQRIVRDLDLAKLESLVSEISLQEVPAAAEAILAGKIRGRTIVKPG